MNQLITTTGHVLLQPNIINVDKQELFDVVNSSIAKCYMDLNLKVPDVVSVEYLVNEVTESIQKRFISLRLAEIPIAFSNGIRKKYGEYFGLCVISFEQFIEGYLESNERLRLIEEKNRLTIDQKIEPTEEQKSDLAWYNLKKGWEFYKANGYFNDFGNAVYNTLLINDKINFTKEQKLEFKAQALLTLEKIHNPLQHMGNLIKMNEARSILDDIHASDHNSRLIAESKKIAINQFFKDMVDTGVELNDLFS